MGSLESLRPSLPASLQQSAELSKKSMNPNRLLCYCNSNSRKLFFSSNSSKKHSLFNNNKLLLSRLPNELNSHHQCPSLNLLHKLLLPLNPQLQFLFKMP